jgi:hypothetical protein
MKTTLVVSQNVDADKSDPEGRVDGEKEGNDDGAVRSKDACSG